MFSRRQKTGGVWLPFAYISRIYKYVEENNVGLPSLRAEHSRFSGIFPLVRVRIYLMGTVLARGIP